MTDTATRELTWPARAGAIPISDLPADQARSFFQWAGANAAQMLSVERERGNVPDDVFAAATADPLTWWLTHPMFDALREQAGLAAPPEPPAELVEELAHVRTSLTKAIADRDDHMSNVARLTAELDEARSAAADPDTVADLAFARQHVSHLEARVAEAEQQMQHERDRNHGLAGEQADSSAAADSLHAELAAARQQVDELAARVHNEHSRVEQLEHELAAAHSQAAAIVPYDDTETVELHGQLAASRHELDQANLHVDRLTEQITMFEADQARHQSVRGLTRTVNVGTSIVMISVAVLVYVGGVAAAQQYAGWSLSLALLVPLAIEAGAAVEIAGIVRDRRLGHSPHWSAWVLTVGLLGSSIVGMILHATNAPAGSHHWWGYWLASWLPIELAMLVRSALGGDKRHTTGRTT